MSLLRVEAFSTVLVGFLGGPPAALADLFGIVKIAVEKIILCRVMLWLLSLCCHDGSVQGPCNS